MSLRDEYDAMVDEKREAEAAKQKSPELVEKDLCSRIGRCYGLRRQENWEELVELVKPDRWRCDDLSGHPYEVVKDDKSFGIYRQQGVITSSILPAALQMTTTGTRTIGLPRVLRIWNTPETASYGCCTTSGSTARTASAPSRRASNASRRRSSGSSWSASSLLDARRSTSAVTAGYCSGTDG